MRFLLSGTTSERKMAETARLNIVVDPSQAISGLDRLKGAMGKVKSAVFSLQTAFASLGAALIARDLIKTGQMFQDIEKKILSLTKNQSTANAIFQNTSKYATEVSFSFEDLFKAAQKLTPILKNSPQEVDRFLRITGDIAAQMGISAEEASTQMIKMLSAGAGAADRFREDGILAMLGFEAGASYSADKTKQKLIEAFQDPNFVLQGVAKSMSNTYTGVMSMIGDKYTQLKQSFNEGQQGDGFFKAVEAIAQGYNKFLDDNIGTAREAFAEFGSTVGEGLIKVVTTGIRALAGLADMAAPIIAGIKLVGSLIGTILNGILEGWNMIPAEVKTLGLIGAILMGPQVIVIGAIVSTALGMIDEVSRAIQKSMAKVGEWATKAGNALGDAFGGETLRELGANLTKASGYFNPVGADGRSTEEKLKAELAKVFSSGDGGILPFTPSEFFQFIDDQVFDGQAGLVTNYSSSAEELIANMENSFDAFKTRAREAVEETKNGLDEVVKKTNDIIEGYDQGAKRYFEGIPSVIESVANITNNFFQGMEDAFVQFAMTGKLSFKDLINSMLADLARLMVQQLIMLPLKAAVGFAEGGIMTQDGPLQLRKYAYGGIANSPQLAMFGEGSTPEAYVPLPDGRTIPVTLDGGKQKGGDIYIENNIDARGGGPEVDQKIRMAVEMSTKETIATIRDLKARGRL
jgi:hypothetical protein